MADIETELLANHKKERKELLGKIQEMKHSIPKGDKKRKKEVNAEIAILEANLAAKHEQELSQLQNSSSADNKEEEVEIDQQSPDEPAKRISKAQKRRNKKADQVREREEAIREQEIQNKSGVRNVELVKINKLLSERGLSIHEVPSDGDCLYKAVEHQLSTLNIEETSVKELRKKTSDYMLSNKDDFIPFLTDTETGDVMSQERYDTYCKDIASAPVWGGQVEIQALSNVCNAPIEVVQADGPSIITGENNPNSKIILSYHRHMYGLGEHYNSVIKKPEEELEQEE